MNTIYTGVAIYALLLALLAVIVYKGIKIRIWKKKGKVINYFKELISGFFVIYLVVLLTVTLWPAPIRWGRMINFVPFRDVYFTAKSQGLIGIASYTVKICFFNILLLIPFGFFGVFWCYFKQSQKYITILGGGLVLILSIETLQFILNTGRAADIDDVILNMLGVAIGILVGKLFVGKFARYQKTFINKKVNQ